MDDTPRYKKTPNRDMTGMARNTGPNVKDKPVTKREENDMRRKHVNQGDYSPPPFSQ